MQDFKKGDRVIVTSSLAGVGDPPVGESGTIMIDSSSPLTWVFMDNIQYNTNPITIDDMDFGGAVLFKSELSPYSK